MATYAQYPGSDGNTLYPGQQQQQQQQRPPQSYVDGGGHQTQYIYADNTMGVPHVIDVEAEAIPNADVYEAYILSRTTKILCGIDLVGFRCCSVRSS